MFRNIYKDNNELLTFVIAYKKGQPIAEMHKHSGDAHEVPCLPEWQDNLYGDIHPVYIEGVRI